MRDVLLRLEGVGDLTIFGEREYSLRVWLYPERLSAYGMTAKDIPDLVAKAKVASSMKANPIALTDAELTEIAERAL